MLFSRGIHFYTILQLGIKPAHIGEYLPGCFFSASRLTAVQRWHSHSLSQRADGLYGGFIIHDISQRDITFEHSSEDLRIRQTSSQISERLLLIGDWYHRNATAMLGWYRSKQSYGYVSTVNKHLFTVTDIIYKEPTPETALFNGANNFNCSRASKFVHCDPSKGTKPSIFVDPTSSVRLRLVNTG